MRERRNNRIRREGNRGAREQKNNGMRKQQKKGKREQEQWRIQGGAYFQTKMRPLSQGLEDHPPPPQPYLKVWIRHCRKQESKGKRKKRTRQKENNGMGEGEQGEQEEHGE